MNLAAQCFLPVPQAARQLSRDLTHATTVVQPFDRFAVAARLRSLIAGQDGGVIGLTASRLGVSEFALRMSVDDADPQPTVEVVIAIVRTYGLDPTWVITGEYDAHTHRRAMEDDRGIARLLANRPDAPPPSKQAPAPADSSDRPEPNAPGH